MFWLPWGHSAGSSPANATAGRLCYCMRLRTGGMPDRKRFQHEYVSKTLDVTVFMSNASDIT